MLRPQSNTTIEVNTGVTFDDVAGCDEAKRELSKVVDVLKYPQRFIALGAKCPGGMLSEGPPGTGKALIVRAVSGEADMPFVATTGSECVIFVGVSASSVLDLFEEAKAKAQCIIFVDEIDAIDRKRA